MAAIWHNAFLETLAATGNVTASAKSVDRTRAAAYLARKKSKRFREQWDEALEQAIDNLELEARRRAQTGVQKPVFYKGKQVGIIREYSDNLADVPTEGA